MNLASLDVCPTCGTALVPVVSNEDITISQDCPSCGYAQEPENRKQLETLGSVLVDECYQRGIDVFVIQEHTLTVAEALRADALLPVMIQKCNNTIKGSSSLPFITIEDKHGLVKYRAVYFKNKGNSNPEFYTFTLISMLETMINETRKKNPDGPTNIIDFDPVLQEFANIGNTLTAKPATQTINCIPQEKIEKQTKPSTTKVNENKAHKNIQIIQTMVDNRKEEAKFGQLNNLMKTGATLQPIPDIAFFSETLNNEFPWFRKATELFCNELTTRSFGKGVFKLPSIILLGDPGIGKTAYCSRLAEITNVPYNFLGLAGSTSNLVLAGTERGWNSAKPSLALQTIVDHKIANPLIVLDEIDKAGGSSRNGHPHHTLLSLLEPSSSKQWYDTFLMGHLDLSHISWLATANDIRQLPRTLLSRFRVVEIDAPRDHEYPSIVWRTRHSMVQEYGIDERWLPTFTEAEWSWLEKYFTTPRMAKRATEELLKNLISNTSMQSHH